MWQASHTWLRGITLARGSRGSRPVSSAYVGLLLMHGRQVQLLQGVDSTKDQSYFLATVRTTRAVSLPLHARARPSELPPGNRARGKVPAPVHARSQDTGSHLCCSHSESSPRWKLGGLRARCCHQPWTQPDTCHRLDCTQRIRRKAWEFVSLERSDVSATFYLTCVDYSYLFA